MDVGLAIGGEIVVARRARGMSQETLAIAAGVSRSTIQRVERGLVSSGETMLSVCAALGLDHAELLRAAERALPVERPPQGAECGFPVPGAGDLPPVSPRDIGTVGVGMVLTLGAAYPGGRFMQAHLVGGGTPWTQWWVEAAVSLVIAALTMAALAAASADARHARDNPQHEPLGALGRVGQAFVLCGMAVGFCAIVLPALVTR